MRAAGSVAAVHRLTRKVRTAVPDWARTPIRLVAFAMEAGMPSHTSAGIVTKLPAPATVFTAPATRPTTPRTRSSVRACAEPAPPPTCS